MTLLTRALFFVFVFTTVLVACGGPERGQREAFEQFLQTRVLDVSGMRVPTLTPEEKDAFGPYAHDYQIISDFHEGMHNRVTEPNNALMKTTKVGSIGEIVKQRKEIAAAKAEMVNLRRALSDEVAKASMARGRLKQPDDIKRKYDQAYDKLVTTPANVYGEVLPEIDNLFGIALKVADYVKAQPNKIEVWGTVARIADPVVEKELKALLDELRQQGDKVVVAQRKMQEALQGY